MTTLFPYQQTGVDFLAGRKAALLADDPGLGKTLQAIRACDRAQCLRVLVICPASVVENWRREIAKYREGDWSAFVTSFDKAASADRERILAQDWCAAVIDEAHYLKTLSAKRTQSVYGAAAKMADDAIASKARHVWLLSGTPMPNNASELYTHLRALAPDRIMSRRAVPYTFHQFAHAYCIMKNTGFGERIIGTRNETALNGKLDGFMLRRRKADVLKDLPPLRFADLYLEGDVSGIDSEEADLIRKTLATDGVDGLRKIAANGSISTLRRLTGMAKAMPAVHWLKDWLDSRPKTDKIVVFVHHKDVGALLYDHLHTVAVQHHGGLNGREKQSAVDRLQKDPNVRVFIGNLKSAGVGITLTAATEILFLESSYVPADMEQAARRIHRISQTAPCLVRTAMVAGSVDEDIQRAIARKMESISKVVDGV